MCIATSKISSDRAIELHQKLHRLQPRLYNNLKDRWLTPRLLQMGLEEKGMGWHSFKRFRKTWLRGTRCLEDLKNFWMAHKPQTMSELYSHLHEELELRPQESERVGLASSCQALSLTQMLQMLQKIQTQNQRSKIAA